MDNTTRSARLPKAALLLGLLGLLALGAGAPARAADVGVSISISQPGVYGRVDIGQYPQPQIYQPQPVYIQRPAYVAQPVYLWVPPGHRKNWRKHCGHYNACGVPVYFVQDNWYRQHVMAGHDDHRHGNGRGHGKGRD